MNPKKSVSCTLFAIFLLSNSRPGIWQCRSLPMTSHASTMYCCSCCCNCCTSCAMDFMHGLIIKGMSTKKGVVVTIRMFSGIP